MDFPGLYTRCRNSYLSQVGFLREKFSIELYVNLPQNYYDYSNKNFIDVHVEHIDSLNKAILSISIAEYHLVELRKKLLKALKEPIKNQIVITLLHNDIISHLNCIKSDHYLGDNFVWDSNFNREQIEKMVTNILNDMQRKKGQLCESRRALMRCANLLDKLAVKGGISIPIPINYIEEEKPVGKILSFIK